MNGAGGSHRIVGMPARFVRVDHDTPLLLPPDLRDWVSPNHMVHFVMDAVDALDLGKARVNHRGTGDAQYPPSMMLGLLFYCYATGIFSSRRIETLTYENVAVRLLCADTHPDHDSICKFRRENKVLIEEGFHQVLELAATSKVLKVGDITVAVDGTKILANASKHSAVSHGHAVEKLKEAREQIAELLAKAEDADSTPLEDGLSIPEEIQRREKRMAKILEAKQQMEQRAKERLKEELAEHEAKLKERAEKRQRTGRKPTGREPEPPREGPKDKDQYNFTDPESRIMKHRGGFEQAYNAQAAVETGTMLVVGKQVTNAPNDKQQMAPVVAAISPVVGTVANVLVDSGYYSEVAVAEVESNGHKPVVYAATERHKHGRTVADLEKKEDPPPPEGGVPAVEVMAHRLATREGRELYRLRKQTVEPVFGIIKHALGFRRFLMRGLEKTDLEWTLVTTAYNLKRLFNLGMRLKTP
jgi:transposase